MMLGAATVAAATSTTRDTRRCANGLLRAVQRQPSRAARACVHACAPGPGRPRHGVADGGDTFLDAVTRLDAVAVGGLAVLAARIVRVEEILIVVLVALPLREQH